jgi:hypothetical protein
MKFRYHGQFCGPGWSDGQYKADAAGFSTPTSYFDACCKDHDRELDESPETRYQADVNFAKCATSTGRLFEAAAVLGYGSLAQITNMTKKSKTKPRLRGSIPKPATKNDTLTAAPVSIATRRTGKAAAITTLSDGVVRLKHRSFVTPVTSNSAYTANVLPCNPGMSGSFPWLSKLARRYDMYRFVALKYSYRSVTATSSSGVVMLSFDYDAADDAPTTKAKQAMTIPNAESNCWTSIDLAVKPDPTWRFTRPGVLAATLDIKTYDLGNLVYSSVYGTVVVTGELYVEYTVELKKPSDGTLDSGSQRFNTTSFATPFASAQTASGYSPYTVLSNTQLQFVSSGEWCFVITTSGTTPSAAVPNPTIATTGSGQVASLFNIVGPTSTVNVLRIRAEVNDIITFASAGAGAAISSLFVRVSVIDYDVYV